MENQSERNVQRRAELMAKHRHIIAKVAREKELETKKELEREREMKRERELERITRAKRAAAVREQNRLAIRQQTRFSKTNRRADGTSKYPLLVAAILELYGGRSIFDDKTRLQPVRIQKPEDDDEVREFLQSIS